MRTCGKIATYNAGCRCEDCRRAAAEARARLRPRTAVVAPPDDGWRAEAACTDAETAVFFPGTRNTDRAKRICDGCSVRAECLGYALRTGQSDGVWGGLGRSERERYVRDHGTTVVELPAIRFRLKERECAAQSCSAVFLPVRSNHRYCSHRCAVRESARRRWAADPEFRERKREANRVYKAEAERALAAQRKARYQANAERLRAERRERYRLNAEAEKARQREYHRTVGAERRRAAKAAA